MSRKIIVDTSVWIEYFKNNLRIVAFMEQNLIEDNICSVGIIIAEIIQGIKNQSEQESVRSNLDAVTYIEMKYDDWIKAGELSSAMRKCGKILPLTDIAIASVAIKNNMRLATLDKHFQLIPDLLIYDIIL
jgi:tRNA(fMet)-specific endonuclease VapC